MHDHIDESLAQKPNVILLHAGTNDMSPDISVSTEGRDPAAAAERLGALIDKMLQKCPDATILVAMIISTTRPAQAPRAQHRHHRPRNSKLSSPALCKPVRRPASASSPSTSPSSQRSYCRMASIPQVAATAPWATGGTTS